MNNIRNCILICITLIAICFLEGCGKETSERPFLSPEISERFRKNQLSLLVSVSEREITTGGRIILTLEAVLDENWSLEFPIPGNKPAGFSIVDTHDYVPRLTEDTKIEYKKEYTLEPFLPGVYTIPPLSVSFWKRGEENRQILEAGEITILVSSVLPVQDPELAIKDIAEPVSVFPRRRSPLFFILPIIIATVALLVSLFRRRLFAFIKRECPRSPAQAALEKLNDLVPEKYTGGKEVRELYFRLSMILRTYLELQFQLRASERTTEEFLHELTPFQGINDDHKALLKDIFMDCDYVKFTDYAPEQDQTKGVLDKCRVFITATDCEICRGEEGPEQ